MKKIFYGWYVVAACVLVAAASLGFPNTASLFVRPVTEEFGFSRGEFMFFRTIVFLLSALMMPFYGRLVMKFSIKKLMLGGTLINGLALAAYSLSETLWHFYLVAVISGLVINAGSFMVIGILICRWFEAKRGLVLGIAFAGSGVGAAIMNPLASMVIEGFEWRGGFIFSGLMSVAVLVPTILFLIKDNPEDMGLEPYRTKENGGSIEFRQNGATFKEAQRSPIFWLLVVALIGLSLSAGGPNAHTVPYLGDLGYSAAFASAVISFSMIFLTVGKILMGIVFDRFGTMTGGLALGIFCILSPSFALLSSHPFAPWLHAIFLGLASTGFSIPVNIYAAKFFGQKDFPVILSTLSMVTALSGAFAPPIMGFVYDFTRSYTPAWFTLVGIGFVVALCLTSADILHGRELKLR